MRKGTTGGPRALPPSKLKVSGHRPFHRPSGSCRSACSQCASAAARLGWPKLPARCARAWTLGHGNQLAPRFSSGYAKEGQTFSGPGTQGVWSFWASGFLDATRLKYPQNWGSEGDLLPQPQVVPDPAAWRWRNLSNHRPTRVGGPPFDGKPERRKKKTHPCHKGEGGWGHPFNFMFKEVRRTGQSKRNEPKSKCSTPVLRQGIGF